MSPAKKIGLVALTAAAVGGGTLAFHRFVDPYETVYKVVDGDTFILATNKQAVRLYGLDAPEIGNCYADQSTSYLAHLLVGKKVQLKEPLVDHFGRVVALVYVNGELVNTDMIKHGYAAYRSEPGSGKAAMLAAHSLAQTQKIGIYSSACTDAAPPDPKCPIKGNHDLDRDEYLYLLPTCPYYSSVIIRRFEGDRWFCTEADAKSAGFRISPACALGTSRGAGN